MSDTALSMEIFNEKVNQISKLLEGYSHAIATDILTSAKSNLEINFVLVNRDNIN